MKRAGEKVLDICSKFHSLDDVIRVLADLQHGVLARWQLIALGFDRSAIQHRIATGRLLPMHHGVYAVGHRRVTVRGHWMAAVLACGPRAVLSYLSAGALEDLRAYNGTKIDVTDPGGGRRPGIRIHRSATLVDEDITVIDGIPVTSIARTILDLASVLSATQLLYVVEQAVRMKVFDLRAVERVIARNPRRKGVRTLNKILADYRGTPNTRSRFERRFLALVRRAGLPEPQLNVVVEGLVVDVFFPEARLVIELDSLAYHLTPAALENDRVRDKTLRLARYEVLRVTDKRFNEDPDGVRADVLAFYKRGVAAA